MSKQEQMESKKKKWKIKVLTDKSQMKQNNPKGKKSSKSAICVDIYNAIQTQTYFSPTFKREKKKD